jgi:hypothetical protein
MSPDDAHTLLLEFRPELQSFVNLIQAPPATRRGEGEAYNKLRDRAENLLKDSFVPEGLPTAVRHPLHQFQSRLSRFLQFEASWGDLAAADEVLVLLEEALAAIAASGNDPRLTPDHPLCFQLGDWDLTTPGEASFRGVRLPLMRQQRRLLACLIRAKGKPVWTERLIAASESQVESTEFAPTISRLNSHLRKHLKALRLPGKPITYCDPESYRLNWR